MEDDAAIEDTDRVETQHVVGEEEEEEWSGSESSGSWSDDSSFESDSSSDMSNSDEQSLDELHDEASISELGETGEQWSDDEDEDHDETSCTEKDATSLKRRTKQEEARRYPRTRSKSRQVEKETHHVWGRVSAMRNRRSPHSLDPSIASSGNDSTAENQSSRSDCNGKRFRGQRSKASHFNFCCGKRSWAVLVVSLVIWMFVQFKYSKWGSSSSDDTEQPFSLPLPEQQLRHYLNREKKEKKIVQLPDDILKLREYRRQEATNALGDAAVDSLKNRLKTSAGGGRKKKGRAEDLPQGCEPAEWQKLSFPNCNEIHEIDLQQAIRKRLSDNLALNNKQEEISEADTFGYVGSGLWRNVWKVDPRGEVVNTAAHQGESVAPSVLKMMKSQHECDARNLDRHRRDALVMERLTAAPGVVSMYGFCGNTVLSEFVGHGLDEIIYKDKRFETTVDKVLHAQKYDSLYPTRDTKIGRLRLAFQVARGLASLHNIPGGPIVHADIQAKQFLIDPVLGVRLNDFNRCRFVTRTTETHEPCPFRIPSAPGGNRSPEEYENVELSEKLDIYSLAHVLYGILTGEKVWAMDPNKLVKNRVKGGQIPPIDSKYRTSDPELVSLMERAYVYDPKKRISATELETELEVLLVTEERRSKGKDSIRRRLRELS